MSKTVLSLKVCIFVLGLGFLSLGINIMTTCSELGLSPWDSLFLSLYGKFGFTIGLWMLIVNGIMTIFVLINNKKNVSIGMITMIFLISLFVDGIRFLTLEYLQNIPDVVAFVTGNILIGTGIGMYLATELLIAPHESFMLTLSERFKWSYRKSEIIASIGAVFISFLLSGPIFWGTIILTFTTGYIIQYTRKKTENMFAKVHIT